MKVSIIIPCYNEEKNIVEIVKKFRHLFEKYDIELILVDNGSKDGTRREIESIREKEANIKLVVVEENQGYGYGILSGLQAASGEILGWMHADLQSDPNVFCNMIEQAKNENIDFLYKGKRSNRPILDTFFTIGMSIFETIFLRKLLWDINAQPTLLSRGFYKEWKNAPYDFSLDLYVYYLAKVKQIKILRFKSVQYERLNGVSTWNTGMSARIKLIKRVFSYSKKMKKMIRE